VEIVEVGLLWVMTAQVEKVLESSVMVIIAFSILLLVQKVSTWVVLLKVMGWLTQMEGPDIKGCFGTPMSAM
jgi:hypothetical protein